MKRPIVRMSHDPIVRQNRIVILFIVLPLFFFSLLAVFIGWKSKYKTPQVLLHGTSFTKIAIFNTASSLILSLTT